MVLKKEMILKVKDEKYLFSVKTVEKSLMRLVKIQKDIFLYVPFANEKTLQSEHLKD
jgi:hypothetical protein